MHCLLGSSKIQLVYAVYEGMKLYQEWNAFGDKRIREPGGERNCLINGSVFKNGKYC